MQSAVEYFHPVLNRTACSRALRGDRKISKAKLLKEIEFAWHVECKGNEVVKNKTEEIGKSQIMSGSRAGGVL